MTSLTENSLLDDSVGQRLRGENRCWHIIGTTGLLFDLITQGKRSPFISRLVLNKIGIYMGMILYEVQ